MADVYFKGFSTYDNNHKNNNLTDIELMKRDLLNHFYTRKGERLGLPEFGSIIWDMLYEPLVSSNVQLIEEDVAQVIANDSRMILQDIIVEEYEHGVKIQVSVLFLPVNVVDTFSVDFDRRIAERN